MFPRFAGFELTDASDATALQGVLSGRITLDGERLSQRKFKKMAGYVQQDDVLLNAATVRETLAFAARMRCAHLSPEGVEERVNKVRVHFFSLRESTMECVQRISI